MHNKKKPALFFSTKSMNYNYTKRRRLKIKKGLFCFCKNPTVDFIISGTTAKGLYSLEKISLLGIHSKLKQTHHIFAPKSKPN